MLNVLPTILLVLVYLILAAGIGLIIAIFVYVKRNNSLLMKKFKDDCKPVAEHKDNSDK